MPEALGVDEELGLVVALAVKDCEGVSVEDDDSVDDAVSDWLALVVALGVSESV